MIAEQPSHNIIIVAGGQGLRMGHDLPKQFIPVSGKPLLMYTLLAFAQWNSDAHIVLVLPAEQIAYWQMLCREIGFNVPHELVEGGETRFHSVRNGLDRVNQKTPHSASALVAIHDGVRPFVSKELISRCFSLPPDCEGTIPAVAVTDSLRHKDPNRATHHSVDRSQYFAVQTPQVFRLNALSEAYKQTYDPEFTDDASVIESAGGRIAIVEGSYENIKITTPTDLLVAEWKLSKNNNP